MASSLVVPPGGFVGYSMMTPASRAALTGIGAAAVRSSRRQGVKIGRAKRKRKKSAKRATARRASSRRTSSRKPKFGSPAWHKKYKTGKFRKK